MHVAHSLQDVTQHVIEQAKKSGASAADVMIREDDTFSVSVRMTEVETLKEALSRGLMLRVFVGKRTATSYTSDLSLPVVDQLVAETVEMARLTSEDESGGLPDPAIHRSHLPMSIAPFRQFRRRVDRPQEEKGRMYTMLPYVYRRTREASSHAKVPL